MLINGITIVSAERQDGQTDRQRDGQDVPIKHKEHLKITIIRGMNEMAPHL
jgi:hypothetical protein